VHSSRGGCAPGRAWRVYAWRMQFVGIRGALAALMFVTAAGAGCASSGSASSTQTASALKASEPDRPMSAMSSKRPPGRGPTLDRQGCDPNGKAQVVVQKTDDCKGTRWLYYQNARRGTGVARVLRCEAADTNGDGYVDARYFYDAQGQLMLEQRDLDFDGHAEVIADYSHFSYGHLTHARDVD